MFLYADTSRGKPWNKNPAVISFDNRYLMFHSLLPNEHIGEKGRRHGIAASTDLIHWEKVGEIPPEPTGCEKNGISAAGAIVIGNTVHLFYQTYGNGLKDAICHAWSTDGITFIRNATNPVFSPSGDWNCGRAIDARVCIHNDHLRMYFATRDKSFETQMLGLATAPLNSGFGRETWRMVVDAPVLEPKLGWEQSCIEAPSILKRNGRFYMFYAGAYNNQPQQIGVAISEDGIAWERLFDQPFLPGGAPGTWNDCESGHPCIFEDKDSQTWLFFQGNSDGGKTYFISATRVGWDGDTPFLLDESLSVSETL